MFADLSLADFAAWYAVFLFSTTAHEAAHALTSLKLGDDTAHRGGQVTLDPTPHLKREPFGMAVVPVISYLLSGCMLGWASAPYDPEWARRHPKRAGWMSLAGPAANLVLVFVAALLLHLGIFGGWFEKPDSASWMQMATPTGNGISSVAAILVSLLFSLNLLLFVFNLFPVPPLDGSGALSLLLPDSMANKYSEVVRSPGLSLFGLFIAWKLFDVIYPAIELKAINWLYPGSHYV